MTSIPYWHMYGGDFLAKTLHLTHEERSIYLCLLLHQYSISGPFPDSFGDQKGDLFRVALCTNKRQRTTARKMLEEFFVLEPDGWWQKRAKSEILKRKRASKKQSDAGKRGAQKRWGTPQTPHAEENGGPHSDPNRVSMGSRARPDPYKDLNPTGSELPVVNSPAPARAREATEIEPESKPETEPGNSSLNAEEQALARKLQADLEFRREAADVGARGPIHASQRLGGYLSTALTNRNSGNSSNPEVKPKPVKPGNSGGDEE